MRGNKKKGLQRLHDTRRADTSFGGHLSEPQAKNQTKWGPSEESENMLLRELKTEKERMKARNEMIIKRDFT